MTDEKIIKKLNDEIEEAKTMQALEVKNDSAYLDGYIDGLEIALETIRDIDNEEKAVTELQEKIFTKCKETRKKLEVVVYKKGFECGNIIKEETFWPAHIEGDFNHIGTARWFEVSEVCPITGEYISTKRYDTAHYTYVADYK